VAAEYVAQSGGQIDLLALDEALHRLAALNPRRSRMVALRFFGGLTGAETAAALGVSDGAVESDRLLYAQIEQDTSRIMVVENFR
jgi:DNA-directed RNA polymerase specialized sigma24 family protein